MSTIKTNRTEMNAADQALVDGLAKHASDIPSLVLGTQTLTNAQMQQRIEVRLGLSKASTSARVVYLAAIAAERAQRVADRQFIDDLKQTVRARYSTDPTSLADFGLKVRARTAPSPTTKVVAATKARATRAARGTKGSKELQAITGDVTGVVVTPVTTHTTATAK